MSLSGTCGIFQTIFTGILLTVHILFQMVQNYLDTVSGRNVRYILTELDQSDIFKLSESYIKKKLYFAEMAEEDSFRVDFMKND